MEAVGEVVKKKRGNPNWGKKPIQENQATSEAKPAENENKGDGFKIPLINGQEPAIIVGEGEQYFEVIIREHNEPQKASTSLTDGINTHYKVALGKPVILPEKVINTAREASYTIIEDIQDPKTLEVTTRRRNEERFSVQIVRPVKPEEAKKWIKEQTVHSLNMLNTMR